MVWNARRAERWQRSLAIVLVASLLPLCGCEGVSYVLHLAEGQLQVQGNVESIADVLASGRLSDTDRAKLELIVAAREHAAGAMGLTAGDSYTQFYDTGGDPLAFNLTAARRDALEPVTWTFPLVGEVPYVAFFDEAYLRDYQQRLEDAGYDTLTYELDAYSTLGVFADPVRSTMLRRSELSLAETIIHELLHNTVWRPGDSEFNESMATFVGRQGAIEFLRLYYGDAGEWPAIAEAYYADLDVVNEFLLGFFAELSEYYAQPITSDEIVAGREAVFQTGRDRFVADVQPMLHYPDAFAGYATLPTNNAWVLGNYRYNLELDAFANVYALTGQDWAATLDVYRAAAAADGDPFEFLRQWVGAGVE
jgi:predicted aminopeptidase